MAAAVEHRAQQWGNHPWQCVGVSDWVTGTRVKAAWAGDHDIVLWRDADGVLHAWRNQCPHRGVRLSLGCIRNNRLTCRYHGWQFDGAGQCVHVPADPAFQPSAALHSKPYPCREQDGFIWVGVRDGESPAPVLDGPCTGMRTLHVARAASDVQDWLSTASLPVLDGVTPSRLDMPRGTPGLLLQFALTARDAFLVALMLQRLPPDESAVHAVAVMPAPSAEVHLELLEWLKRLRGACEAALPDRGVA